MFLIRLISRLPFPVLYLFSDFLFFVSYRLVGYRRKMVWKNLTNAFPEKTQKELSLIERNFYSNLCDYAVETLKLLTISKEEISRRMVFTNPESITGCFDKGISVIHLTSHQFNWEWLLAHGSFVYGRPMDFVYQSVNSPFFDNLSFQIRTRFGSYPISRYDVARESIKRKNIVRGIAIIADQYPGLERDKKHFTTFLNQETVFFYGANQLAVILQYPVFFHAVRKVKRGYYETTTVKISDPPYDKNSSEIVEHYVREVEKVIRQYPDGWLWSHNRWKKRHLKDATPS
jgi:Kdo2-lipid IVA lauroyltransferase/acyltransferase